jgi:hypothetical protein
LLKPDDLKNWLHREISNTNKALLVLSTFDRPAKIAEIRDRFKTAGLRKGSEWNLSSLLGGTKGLAINTPSGWELSDAGKQHLHTLGVGNVSPAAVQIATDLRGLLKKIMDEDTKAFVEEAVRCYEFGLYRSAVVMSWLAAMHVLKLEVLNKHLAAFNAEAHHRISQNPKKNWKTAKTTDDLGLMNEAEFLDCLAAISILGKNVKGALVTCLNTRNSCGHPNTFKLGPNVVAHHIEVLLLNVFNAYCR